MGIENFILNIIIFIGIYIILGISLQIALGYTGLLNFGHAAFYGIGAYTSALLAVNLHFPFFLSLTLGAVTASLFGLLLSLPTIKLRGDYLALATIGFGVIIEQILKNWKSLTRGPLGIPGIPKPTFFGTVFIPLSWAKYYLINTPKIIDGLIKIQWLLSKPTHYGLELSLNTDGKKEIEEHIEKNIL